MIKLAKPETFTKAKENDFYVKFPGGTLIEYMSIELSKSEDSKTFSFSAPFTESFISVSIVNRWVESKKLSWSVSGITNEKFDVSANYTGDAASVAKSAYIIAIGRWK